MIKILINKILLLVLIFTCSAMQEDSFMVDGNRPQLLYDFFAAAPELVKERICSYLKPYEFETGMIIDCVEKCKKGSINQIPEQIYALWDNLEYHHKLGLICPLAFCMNPRTHPHSSWEKYNEVKERLKAGIQKTKHINIYVAGKGLQGTTIEKLFLLPLSKKQRLESFQRLLKFFEYSNRSNADWWNREERDYMTSVEKELQQKYHLTPFVYKGKIIKREVWIGDGFEVPDKKVDSFVVTIPFSLIPRARDEYLKKLEDRVDQIFQEESAIKFN